jgi:glutathione S-transferase
MWLEIESQHLNTPLSKIVYEKVFKQMRGESDVNEELVKTSLKDLDSVLSIYENNLNSKFISGDTFTIADIACIPYLNYFVRCQGKDYLKKYPKFYHWYKKVKSRDSVKKIIN